MLPKYACRVLGPRCAGSGPWQAVTAGCPTIPAGQASRGELPEDPILAGIVLAFWPHHEHPPKTDWVCRVAQIGQIKGRAYSQLAGSSRARSWTCMADLTSVLETHSIY
eukprot:280840-Pelagomonas_calceolata.AAC.4